LRRSRHADDRTTSRDCACSVERDGLYRRASAIDPHISIATVYRTVRLFEEAGVVEKHDFGDGRSRYEEAGDDHHDHLIDTKTGEVIEFFDAEIERLKNEIARKLGFELVGHKLELYGHAIPGAEPTEREGLIFKRERDPSSKELPHSPTAGGHHHD
jgi:Fur family ferric uptake transcriptional regulator